MAVPVQWLLISIVGYFWQGEHFSFAVGCVSSILELGFRLSHVDWKTDFSWIHYYPGTVDREKYFGGPETRLHLLVPAISVCTTWPPHHLGDLISEVSRTSSVSKSCLKLYVMLKLMVVILEFCNLLINTNLTDLDSLAKLIIVGKRGKRCWGLGQVLISVNSLWHETASLSVNGEHAKELAKQH